MDIHPICTKDGRVEVDSSEITLTLFDSPYGTPYYTFCCPSCGVEYHRPASSATVALLFPSVKREFVHIPLELAEEAHLGPAITEADVQDFLIELGLEERARHKTV